MSDIAIIGAGGKMGRTLTEATVAASASLVAAVEAADSPWLGQDAGTLAGVSALQVPVTDSMADAARRAKVMIEFSRPHVTMAALDACVAEGCALVSGTTGLDDAQRDRLRAAAEQVPVLVAANFSVGVNVCLKLLADAARALGDDFDVEIVEAHHRHKVDAPSGTALAMGEAVAGALGRDLKTCAVYGREGHTGERDRQTIGFETIRGGDVVGEHTVMFLGAGERVEIGHRASSRMNFAAGAVRAALWLDGRAPGLYSMQDVLAD